MSAEINYTRRVALFASLTFPDLAIVFSQPAGCAPDDSYNPVGYVRASDWQDVEFAPITVASEQIVHALNEQRRAIVAESSKKLEQIDGQIVKAMATMPVKS